MVIELSGVQFGLKSYTGAQREFHLRPQIWIQTKIARHEVQLPHYYGHFEIAESCQYQYLFDLVAGLSKSRSKKAFTSHFIPETEVM